jgi:FlaA1/EpsC-like NDP-sugar epimerase
MQEGLRRPPHLWWLDTQLSAYASKLAIIGEVMNSGLERSATRVQQSLGDWPIEQDFSCSSQFNAVHTKSRRADRLLRAFLIGLPRSGKSAVAIASDMVGFGLCVLAALWLIALSPQAFPHYLVVVATPLISIGLASWQGMYRSVVRYMGPELLIVGSRTALGSAVAGAVLMNISAFGSTPYRWVAAYAAFSFFYICSSRYFARLFLINNRARARREAVIIYGAGSAGVQLAVSLQSGNEYMPIAMLDDDPKLHGKKVTGLEVYRPSALATLCRESDVQRVLLAVPRAGNRGRRQILQHLSGFPVQVQTIPDFGDIVSGKARVDEISDVDVEDLLGRDPVPPNPQLLEACVTGKNVLVTGAGGSIGSELCRQLLALNPKRLIMFEISEAGLYSIHRQLEDNLRASGSDCELVPLLGSVSNDGRISDVMRSFEVQTVYHAAAYKHVPLVEHNLFEGIHNNVFGTMRTARAAMDSGVETFVLISTDKAVNPTSIMGATKRLSELILQANNNDQNTTRFCMVRFGNVLDSSGSVVPLFREQIRNYGPITITHRDIIRYFMSIPEAAELVIQAGSMARGGDVFVLDMGDPVRIQDLAYRMVNLMGLTVQDDDNPDGDIPIQYIGLRPGEKLYEELLIGSDVSGTDHPRIMRADENYLPVETLNRIVGELEIAAAEMDIDRARGLLSRAVGEYRPTNGIDDLVWLRKNAPRAPHEADTVIAFPSQMAN